MKTEFTPPECGDDGECSRDCLAFDGDGDSIFSCKLGLGDPKMKELDIWKNDVFPGVLCGQFLASLEKREAAMHRAMREGEIKTKISVAAHKLPQEWEVEK